MRTLLAAALALILLAVPATSQSLLEDPAGDVAAIAGGTAPIPQAGTWSAVDVRALDVLEDPVGFRFEALLEDLGEDGARTDYGNVQARFTFGDCTFSLNMYRSQDNAAYFGNLYRFDGQTGAIVRGLRVERDLAEDRIGTTVDRFDLACAGAIPQRGDVLGGLNVRSYANLPGALGSGVLWVGDLAPDSGSGPDVPVQFGGVQAHGARLATPAAFRASNGEATTYQYDLTASHDGDTALRFRVFVEGVPTGWNVSLPGEFLELPAGQPVSFPLHVSTVFRHEHGSAETLQVHLHEVDGERWASLEVGVNFLAVPQPSGHHPFVYLHSNDWSGTAGIVNAPLGSTGGYLTMNTLDEDPSDTRKPAIGRSQLFGVNSPASTNQVGVSRFFWSACLEPGLSLGLDFDLAGTGTIEVPIHAARPMPAAHLTGRLLHLGPGKSLQYCFPSEYSDRATTVLAELDFASADLDPDGRHTYAATITPSPAADFIVAQDGALMVLELTLETVGMPMGGTAGANLEPGAWMQLPLRDYHDPVGVVMPTSSVAVAGFVPPPQEGKDASALLAAPLALALAALRRRR